ncbi:MAG: isocitrate lyase/phosphoenolpyruvate mutase family protein [Candidatus Eremiobacteraeota bacterium]|nr:isocitrate lyase/phosphoenolpyruvate mutase family protein [Candidatus Eremiobacteraeota bacterium]
MSQTTSHACDRFRALHRSANVLVLPNAWDAGSAAIFRAAGAPAIATTSAGVAWSCGFPDGDALPMQNLIFAIDQILGAIGDTPLSVDVEGGYADNPSDVADNVGRLADMGIAGINIEDGGGDPAALAAKIAAIVKRCPGLFVNARTDVYLRDLAEGDAAIRQTIERGKIYAAAGASGLFVPGAAEAGDLKAIAAGIDVPLAIFAVPGLLPAKELYALGVRRLSAGESLAALAYGTARDAAAVFLRDGRSDDVISPRNVDYGETNALFRH